MAKSPRANNKISQTTLSRQKEINIESLRQEHEQMLLLIQKLSRSFDSYIQVEINNLHHTVKAMTNTLDLLEQKLKQQEVLLAGGSSAHVTPVQILSAESSLEKINYEHDLVDELKEIYF